MSFDIKSALASIAPTIATMLAGPFAGTAISALESACGLAPGSGTEAITKVLSTGMTPDITAAIRAADQKHAEIMGQQGIDLIKVNNDFQTAQMLAVIDDRKDARKSNSSHQATWWLAGAILATFALIMAAVLYGCWTLIIGGITLKDPSVVAAISGLVGAVVGYVASNAQTVVNFVYGGSLGSEKKTDALAASVQQAIGTAK